MMDIWLFISTLLALSIHIKAVEVLPCHFFDSKNISDGLQQSDGSILFEGIVYPKNQYATVDYVLERTNNITADSHIRGCTCNIKPCLRLCCPLRTYQTRENGTIVCSERDGAQNFEAEVLYENSNETKLLTLDHHFAYVEGRTCKSMYLETEYQITHKGQIQLDENILLTHHEYCLHSKLDNETNEVDLAVLVCADQFQFSEHEPRYIILAYCMLISVMFLCVTLFVYVVVPKLQNLQGKCLICYLVSLAVSYLLMAFIHLNGHNYVLPYICYPTGFIMLFSFLAAFFWLNVMNFDLWLHFRSKSKFKQLAERKQFNLYSTYGFGIPVIFTALVFILDNFVTLPYNLRPGIGDSSCFLTNMFLYFYLPIGFIFMINIGFFVMIALQIRHLQNDLNGGDKSTPKCRQTLQSKREKYILFLRLFFVMGVVWSMEVVSYLIDPKSEFFMLTDICNTLQGLFIFILFVVNRRVFGLLKERWRNFRGQTNSIRENDLSRSATYVPLSKITSTKL
ncbi:G-protein coupled receptor Mth2-like [Contarinia nasturtii]|uniref:G-protein coupled receptor Mth2-like n=1 Tax=Contarinia nasturtii TaxID=265458 RepID=UPI0012D46B77|nr:G-protein coupled receptor Mth2-like [Contarinia nasturtii]XP_031617282.1 G-protein coupled receptor Mth2-like [Contarinia nasturtii]